MLGGCGARVRLSVAALLAAGGFATFSLATPAAVAAAEVVGGGYLGIAPQPQGNAEQSLSEPAIAAAAGSDFELRA